MEKVNLKVRKWGNSFGVVLPKRVVDTQQLDEGTEITITIEPQNKMTVADVMKLGEQLGLDKKLKNVNTQKALDEIDNEFWPEED